MPILNMPKFWIWPISGSGRVVNMPAFHSVPNMPEYFLYDRVLNISRALHMPVFWIQKLHRVLNMPQCGWIYLNWTWICLKTSEFTIINRLLNMFIQYIVTLQLTEYLLRDIQNWSKTWDGALWKNNYNF